MVIRKPLVVTTQHSIYYLSWYSWLAIIQYKEVCPFKKIPNRADIYAFLVMQIGTLILQIRGVQEAVIIDDGART